MERAKPWHAFDLATDECTDPVLHFARGLVGEGHCEDFARACTARCEDMRNTCGQHARLARASTRQNQYRTIKFGYGFALFGVQTVEIGGAGQGAL